MAPTGERAFLTLREWVRGLNLARGQVIATDLAGLQQPDPKAWWGVPVFLKYSSTGATPGDASIVPYNGPNRGVIFTPMLPDGQFRQYGDLPLYTFTDPPLSDGPPNSSPAGPTPNERSIPHRCAWPHHR
eukprot:TRINITY_DN13187_c0_g1_i1.p5 TRINITY_DN13187_c0_g1~~TRINITY_DN13187_c0_g1_i1.p5  ORF type:complete len:130 (-),score=30.43 TRINITY_DN13187_c0_g1_i1:15-404(-)